MNRLERNLRLTLAVLDGMPAPRAAYKYEVYPSSVRIIIARTCEEIDPMLFASACDPDGNYPGILALRACRHKLGPMIRERLDFETRQSDFIEDPDYGRQTIPQGA